MTPITTKTLTLSPTPEVTSTITPMATSRSTSRIPSGWTLYSNPDFVEGIVVYGNHLWAATLGGVVDWNLDTKTPKVYTTRDGLVEIQANDIVICSMTEDRVLISHEAGFLSAYDLSLKKWSRLPITFDDGSTLNGVSALFCDEKNSRLLVGSSGGLGILDLKTGRWKRFGAKEGLKADVIETIDGVGQAIWIAAGKQSAFMITGNTVFPFNSTSGFPSGPVNDLSVGPDNSIWLGYPTGLVHYRDKHWNSYGNQTSTGLPFVSVDEVFAGTDNSIWIASADEGICPFDISTRFCSTIYPAPRGASISDLEVSEDGRAFAATQGNGILVLEPENRTNLLLNPQNLISNDVYDVAEGVDGRLWVATGQGINVFDLDEPTAPWQSILPSQNGLREEPVSGLLPVSNGLWLYYDTVPEVNLITDEGDRMSLSEDDGLSGLVNDAEIDQQGYIWFATEHGIDIWDGTVFRSYGPDTGLPGNVFQALYERNGVMWVGSDMGLFKYERYQWTVVLPEIPINAIAPYEENKLLLGTDRGLIVYDGNQSFQWVINLSTEVYMNFKVTSITLDRLVNLWVGTDTNGIFYFNGVLWENFDTTHGIPTNHIRNIFTDHMGTVWISAATRSGGGALVRFVP